jgi:prepilin-type N-terminal cleavage/methylation domain-containing protein
MFQVSIPSTRDKFQGDGFTLLEIILVVAIISIIVAVTVPKYSSYRISKALIMGADQVTSDIRMTQNYTYGTLRYNGDFPEGGYGIHFSKGSNNYVIFADKDANQEYETDNSEDFEEIELPRGIKIKSLKKTIGTTTTDHTTIDLVFTPPYGVVFIDGENSESAGSIISLKIEVSNSDGSKTKTIEIESSGRIK